MSNSESQAVTNVLMNIKQGILALTAVVPAVMLWGNWLTGG